jgi:hypothetical protein
MQLLVACLSPSESHKNGKLPKTREKLCTRIFTFNISTRLGNIMEKLNFHDFLSMPKLFYGT